MSTLIIIPARKGSKGIKNKNKININGKKLIEYIFEIVNKLNFKSEICLSTDDEEIIKLEENSKYLLPLLDLQNISKILQKYI